MTLQSSATLPSNVSEAIARRTFLGQLAAASTAALMSGEPRPASANDEPVVHPKASADSCILLWMAGGMAAPETFDPKRYHSFEIGTPVEKVMSTFQAIDTAVDNIKICEGMEQIAGVMDRATLIRSHFQPDLGSILHSRHQYHWHTGYVPPQTVAAPHIGAVLARTLGPKHPDVPAFIDIGQRSAGGEDFEVKAFQTAGFLGSAYGPFLVPEPTQAIATVQPPSGMSKERFRARDRKSVV